MGIEKVRNAPKLSRPDSKRTLAKGEKGSATGRITASQFKGAQRPVKDFHPTVGAATSKALPKIPQSLALEKQYFDPEKSIGQQSKHLRDKLTAAAQDPFKFKVPLVVARRQGEIIAGRSEIITRFESYSKRFSSDKERQDQAWMQAFHAYQLIFFLDMSSPPLQINNILDTRKSGINTVSLLSDLLAPEFSPQSALLLYAYMCHRGAFGVAAKDQEGAFLAKIDTTMRQQGELDLMLASVWAPTTDLCEYLLKLGVSPNAYNPETGFYVLHICDLADAPRHRQLLLKYGADSTSKPQKVKDFWEP